MSSHILKLPITVRAGLVAIVFAACALQVSDADAEVLRGARENAAGGVIAGGAHDVRGPWGGRSVGEGGVVTSGNGGGVSGQRGCANGAAGGRGCGASATAWDRNGNVAHEQSGYSQGAFGGAAHTSGGFTRDSTGYVSGDRDTEVTVGDRTYSADTSFNSDDGFNRDVTCSGSCPD